MRVKKGKSVSRATRADVAKKAGVSTATVSNVLNNTRNVSEKKRKLVLDAVREMDYKPDMIARGLKKNETMQLALMLNDMKNPLYSEIAMEFENAAIEKGYFVNVCTGYNNINRYFDNYIARRIDGVFVVAVPDRFDVDKLYSLTDNGIKVVVSGNIEADLKKVSSIESDYMSGMFMAVDYLYRLGHRKIAYLSGLGRSQHFDDKISGYLNAIEKKGMDCGEELLLEGQEPYTTNVEDGRRMAEKLVRSGREFTAVICTNDLMAMGAISAFESLGLRVPEDVSVMGFDDIYLADTWKPALTTIAVSKAELGRKAFDFLYANIQEGTTGYYLSPVALKERASTGIASGVK